MLFENEQMIVKYIENDSDDLHSFSIDIKELRERRWIVAEYDCTCMIDQHGNTGDHFEHTAA